MKNIFFGILTALSMMTGSQTLAAENSIMASIKSGKVDFDKIKSVDAGMTISSLNSGSAFANVAITHEFGDWFSAGIRGLLPLDIGRPTQTYAAQVYGRFPVINTEDVAFIEPSVSQGFFNGRDKTSPFWMLGASYGYFHRFGGDYTAGINFGADYSPTRIASDKLMAGNSSLYSHLTLTGGFYW